MTHEYNVEMKILIVDDNKDARLILKKTLESAGYKVQDAPNGLEALNLAKASPPDMIISDILMPEMDGYKLCREVKQNKTLRKIPFIFYTSTFTTSKDEKHGEALGASQFIIKPTEPDKFLHIINNLITKHKESRLHVPRMPLDDETELAREHEEIVSQKLDKKIKDLEDMEHALLSKDAQLRASEKKYRKLVESVSDAIIIADADSGVIIDANKQAEELLGIPLDKIKGMHQTDIYPKEEADKRNKLFKNHLRADREISGTVFVVHKSGRNIPVEISTSKININGKNIVQGIYRNISTRIKTENELS